MDYVGNRVLRRPHLSDADWRKAAERLVKWLRRTPYAPGRDRAFISLLARTSLLSDIERDFVLSDAESWINWIKSRSPGSFDAGRLHDAIKGFAMRGSFARERPDGPSDNLSAREAELSETVPIASDLTALAGNPTRVVGREVVQGGLAQAQRYLESGRTGPVGYFLAPLLPLATRLADPEVQAQVHSLVGQFLSHPAVTAEARNGFAGACYRLLEKGAWSQPETAAQFLESLGLAHVLTADHLTALAGNPTQVVGREVVQGGLAQAQRYLV